MHVRYVSATIDRPVRADQRRYGEIWYDVGGRKAMSRAITAKTLCSETIYTLAGVSPVEPTRTTGSSAGIRSRRAPRGAALIFYVLWPALIVG